MHCCIGSSREGGDGRGGEAGFPTKLRDICWRLDVAISSSAAAKVMEPQINFDVSLANGETRSISLTQDKFQQLRFAVASMLKQMELLEKKKVFKSQEGRRMPSGWIFTTRIRPPTIGIFFSLYSHRTVNCDS